MTVRQLIEMLENFDDDMEVKIGMRQSYGSDFAMAIEDINEQTVNKFRGGEHTMVVITEGQQIGTVSYEDEW
jgi:hypothetical protein